MPAGDYQPSTGFDGFVGCPMNGTWKLRVTDEWGSDNGFIFASEFNLSGDGCNVVIE